MLNGQGFTIYHHCNLEKGQGEPFSQIWKGFTKGMFLPSLVKFGQLVSEVVWRYKHI